MDNVIAAIEANHPNLTNQKILYVEISRARDRAELVTDDKAALKKQLEALTGERIAALEALGDTKANGLGVGLEERRSADRDVSGSRSQERERTTGPEMERAGPPKSVDRGLEM